MEDPLDKDNYWPQSILYLLSKVLEKIINNQVYSYIRQYLNPLFCGFSQGHDTQHALFQLLQASQKKLDESGYKETVLMDLLKAYIAYPMS